jgi:hypothetical protein
MRLALAFVLLAALAHGQENPFLAETTTTIDSEGFADLTYTLPEIVCPNSGSLTFSGVRYLVTLPSGVTEPLCPADMTLEEAKLRINILHFALEACGERNLALRKDIVAALDKALEGMRR